MSGVPRNRRAGGTKRAEGLSTGHLIVGAHAQSRRLGLLAARGSMSMTDSRRLPAGHRWDPHPKGTPRERASRSSRREPASSPSLRSARTPVAPTRVRSAACRTGLPGARSTPPPSAEYLAARFEAGHSPAVAGQVVAAVRFYTKLGDQASPNRVGHRTGAGRVPA